MSDNQVHGVTWLLIRDGHVILERCKRKSEVLGVGEWFVPGGKLERGEDSHLALRRELREEWPGLELECWRPLPIVEGSRVPAGERGIFLMRPFIISIIGEPPERSGDGVELRWTEISEAMRSPVIQVRMMVAAAICSLEAQPLP